MNTLWTFAVFLVFSLAFAQINLEGGQTRVAVVAGNLATRGLNTAFNAFREKCRFKRRRRSAQGGEEVETRIFCPQDILPVDCNRCDCYRDRGCERCNHCRYPPYPQYPNRPTYPQYQPSRPTQPTQTTTGWSSWTSSTSTNYNPYRPRGGSSSSTGIVRNGGSGGDGGVNFQ